MISSDFIKQPCSGRRWLVPVVCLLFIAATATVLRADDWPLARRDTMSTGSANSAIPERFETLWTYRAAENAGFDATAVVADGIVYVGDTEGTVHAIRLADGKSVWTKQFKDSSFGAAAAIDQQNGRLYVGDLYGFVRCLAIADGTEIWKNEQDAEIYAGPMIFEDSVLVTSESGTLTCFDGASGEERWQFEIDAPLRCTPTIAEGSVMLAGCDSKLHFIDATSGTETGIVEIDGPTGCTAAVRGSRAFFGTEGGTFYAIDVPCGKNNDADVAWTYRDARRGQPIRAAAALGDNIVIYGSQGKAIYGLDQENGEEKWKLVTRSRVESSPVIAGDRVVAATVGGVIYVLDVATGKEIRKIEVGGSFVASPVVVDQKILLGNEDGALYCFGIKGNATKVATTEGNRTESRTANQSN